jgi:katanin p60 ATPase-containing subunit A1
LFLCVLVGKTLLAKAVATECNTTFFNISASTLISKWRGDSEKLVRVLFDLARYHAPSTIFLDEIDSILTSRDSNDHGGGEHEASRRMKTELLIQLDGISHQNTVTKGGKPAPPAQVFVMAASNLPWELDIALLRRLEKRVLVSLPTPEAREMMLKKHLSDRASKDIDFQEIAQCTEGYSGADLELVCRETAMMPVRRLISRIDSVEQPLPDPPNKTGGAKKASSSSGKVTGNVMINTTQIEIDNLLKNDPVTKEDILAALHSTKPSSDGKISK